MALCCSFTHTGNPAAKTFPKSWDSTGFFKDKMVLAWKETEAGHMNKWRYRRCVALERGRDSVGKTVYFLTMYDGAPNSPYWYVPSRIGYVYIAYRDMFDHLPDTTEVSRFMGPWDDRLSCAHCAVVCNERDTLLWNRLGSFR